MTKMNKTLLGVIIVAIIVVITIGTSFAYMTDNLTGGAGLEVINVDNGKMVVAYQGNTGVFKSSDYGKIDELIGSKTFSITGTNNSSEQIITYNLSVDVNYNEYADNEVYFILGGKSDGNGKITDNADAKTKYYLNNLKGVSTINLGEGFFSTNTENSVHTYVIYYYSTSKKNNKNFETKVRFSAVD